MRKSAAIQPRTSPSKFGSQISQITFQIIAPSLPYFSFVHFIFTDSTDAACRSRAPPQPEGLPAPLRRRPRAHQAPRGAARQGPRPAGSRTVSLPSGSVFTPNVATKATLQSAHEDPSSWISLDQSRFFNKVFDKHFAYWTKRFQKVSSAR